MHLEEFVNKYNGKKVDYDGVYGAQCVDLFRQYVKECLGIKEHTGSCLSSGGAKDLFLDYPKMPIEKVYFNTLTTISKEDKNSEKDFVKIMEENLDILKKELYTE